MLSFFIFQDISSKNHFNSNIISNITNIINNVVLILGALILIDYKSLFPLILSLLAGLSTVLGAFMVFFSKSNNKKLITFSLALSAGVMITISFTDLYPSACNSLMKNKGDILGILYSLLFMIIGIIIAALIGHIIPSYNNEILDNSNSLYRIGFVTMIALMLHNFPEGIATFISGYEDKSLGIYIAIAISLHNIPEGISIAMPIYYSTNNKVKAFKYTLLSGIAEPLGALTAFLLLKPFINEIILGICFAIVSGIMLYIAFEELIPESRSYGYNFIYLFSLVLGICIIPLSHLFL